MKKKILKLFAIILLLVFIATTEESRSTGSNDCIFPAWAHSVNGEWKVDCPTFSGNTQCKAACNSIPGPGPNSNR